MTLGIATGVAVLKSGVTLLARILGNQGIPITRATIQSISYSVRDLTVGTTTASDALTPAAVIFDTLQQADPRWLKDTAKQPGPDGLWGYNFLTTLSATLFTAFDVDATTKVVAPHRYQVDVKFTPVSGQPFVQPFQFTPVPVYVS